MAISEDLLENLDGSWPDDLRAYANKLKALTLEGEDAKTRDLLVKYAETKARAMEDRIAGRPSAAERTCDMIYDQLPKYAKW